MALVGKAKNEDCEIFLNEVECEDEVMEETKKDPSLQTKEYKIIWWKKMKKINYYIFKGKNGDHIIGKYYVGHFSMWMAMESDTWCTSTHALYIVLFQSCFFF